MARVGLASRVAAGMVVVGLIVTAVIVAAMAQRTPASPTEALGAPRMIEETSGSGVTHSYEGDWRYFEGGGVAAFDCDDDGMLDLHLAGGEAPAAFYRNVGTVAGELRFEAVDMPELAMTGVTGSYPLDVDSDGIVDLVVLRIGENVILRGGGDCTFARANEMWGIDGGSAWTVGFSATWEQGNEFPTLAFGNYLKSTDPAELQDGTDLCAPNVVLRPEGTTYGPPIALDPGLCSLSLLFSDWGRDGVADLRVTNDRQYYRTGEEQLWAISPGSDPVAYSRDDGWNHLQVWGMGIASHDITGDGYPEVYLTSQGDNKLQSLTDGPERPSYSDIAIRRGVTAHAPYLGDDPRPSTAWHAQFEDVNNDGFVDLFVAKGNVDAMPTFTDEDPNNLFLGQPDGTFVEGAIDAGIVHFDKTRGAALVDLNRDGLLDLVEVNRTAPVRLWRNLGAGSGTDPVAMGNWLAVRIDGEGPNPRGVGAWIGITVGDHIMVREVTVGGGHASGQWDWIHFGLGPASSADITVTWPDGTTGSWDSVTANRYVTLTPGNATADEEADPTAMGDPE
ncbi:MAG: CRTAC1 family protein [Acidimicrobiia bacterium]